MASQNSGLAAIWAGYNEKTAQEQNSRLLSNVMVRLAIEAKNLIKPEIAEAISDRIKAHHK